MSKYLIVTNNPKVRDEYIDDEKFEIDYIEYDPKIGYRIVLERSREYIHKGGYKMETHPLSGSVKPNETPYKTVVLSIQKNKKLDMDGLYIMEDSLATFDKFKKNRDLPLYNDQTLDDCQEIDYSLISGAIERFPY